MKLSTLALTTAILAVCAAPAFAASYPTTLQKQCSIEFQQKPKETRGGFEGWRTFYKTCSAAHKAAGDTFAKRSKKATEGSGATNSPSGATTSGK